MKIDEHKYDDILNVKWPLENRSDEKNPYGLTQTKLYGHERMSLNERAKIFLPFAALKGFEEELERRKLRTIKNVNDTEGSIQFDDENFTDEESD